MWILTINGMEYVASEGYSRAGWTDLAAMDERGLIVSIHSLPSYYVKEPKGTIKTGGNIYRLERK